MRACQLEVKGVARQVYKCEWALTLIYHQLQVHIFTDYDSLVFYNSNYGVIHISRTFNYRKNILKNNDSPVQTFRALREIFGPRNRPSTRVIARIVSNFEENHTLLDRKKVPHKRPVRKSEKMRRSQQLNVSRTSLQPILTVDLKLYPYKIKLMDGCGFNKTALHVIHHTKQ